MLYSDDASTGLLDLTPSVTTFLQDAQRGLRSNPKTLPCKYFYDARGSALFDEICELDEYYLTRTELSILRANIDEIAESLGSEAMLIEPGSGSGVKTQILLEHLDDPVAYVPVEISREHLLQSAESLAEEFVQIEVIPVCADFTRMFEIPSPDRAPRRRVVFFPGSTIGNFEPPAAARLLRQWNRVCGEDGALLIGVDLRKDRAILEAAYDDADGVTAEFNLNILRRMNAELDADFEIDQFEHHARYNAEAGRIEIFLISRSEQSVTVGEEAFEFADGEPICTEHSHKYDISEFAELAAEAGWNLSQTWTDDDEQFAVLCLETSEPV